MADGHTFPSEPCSFTNSELLDLINLKARTSISSMCQLKYKQNYLGKLNRHPDEISDKAHIYTNTFENDQSFLINPGKIFYFYQ